MGREQQQVMIYCFLHLSPIENLLGKFEFTPLAVYYQWVPFVLALQCVLFIIPRFIWQMLTYNHTGTDLENLVKTASEAARDDPDSQGQKVQHIAYAIKNMILATRDTRRGGIANIRRRCNKMFGVFAISKRLGTWVAGIYMLLKVIYFINSVGQIYMMQRFLGLHKNYTYFGAEIARDIVSGRDWQQTEVFPRVTFCRVPIQHLGAINYQTSQCVLAINFLNEKIYIFLWFWLVMVSIFTLVSIPVWYCRIMLTGSRTAFIKKNLLLCNNFRADDRALLGAFTRRFLRYDGLFMLRMLALNAGDLVTSEVVGRLFSFYKDDFLQRDMCDDRCFNDPDQLPAHVVPPRRPPLAPRAPGDATLQRGASEPLYPAILNDDASDEKPKTRM